MALTIPTFPNPFDPANPLANAYAWTAFIALDLSRDAGRLVLNVHPNESAYGSPPVAQLAVTLGEVFTPADPSADPPVAEVRFPRLDELMGDPQFAAAYQTIGLKLYTLLAALHPKLAGASVIPTA